MIMARNISPPLEVSTNQLIVALVILNGEKFQSGATIPSNKFRAESVTVQLSATVPNLSVDFSLPGWNTRAAYMPKEGCNLARVGSVFLNGSYHYNSETREDLVDRLILNFEVKSFNGLYWKCCR